MKSPRRCAKPLSAPDFCDNIDDVGEANEELIELIIGLPLCGSRDKDAVVVGDRVRAGQLS